MDYVHFLCHPELTEPPPWPTMIDRRWTLIPEWLISLSTIARNFWRSENSSLEATIPINLIAVYIINWIILFTIFFFIFNVFNLIIIIFLIGIVYIKCIIIISYTI